MRPFVGSLVPPLLLFGALVAAAVAYAWLVPESGFPTWLRLREEVVEADGRIRLLERENQALRDEVAALRTDPFAQERAVREELGWVRPGEVLVRLPAGSAPAARRAVP